MSIKYRKHKSVISHPFTNGFEVGFLVQDVVLGVTDVLPFLLECILVHFQFVLLVVLAQFYFPLSDHQDDCDTVVTVSTMGVHSFTFCAEYLLA